MKRLSRAWSFLTPPYFDQGCWNAQRQAGDLEKSSQVSIIVVFVYVARYWLPTTNVHTGIVWESHISGTCQHGWSHKPECKASHVLLCCTVQSNHIAVFCHKAQYINYTWGVCTLHDRRVKLGYVIQLIAFQSDTDLYTVYQTLLFLGGFGSWDYWLTLLVSFPVFSHHTISTCLFITCYVTTLQLSNKLAGGMV